MKELKFRNALNAIICGAIILTVYIVICSMFVILMTYVFDGTRDFSLGLIIVMSIVVGAWIIAGLVILLQGTVVVTDHEIKYMRGNAVKWIIEKQDIKECIYNKCHWYDFLMPISAINVFALQFKLKNGVVSRKKYCSLSYKKVQIICNTFNYPIRNIDSIYEQ